MFEAVFVKCLVRETMCLFGFVSLRDSKAVLAETMRPWLLSRHLGILLVPCTLSSEVLETWLMETLVLAASTDSPPQVNVLVLVGDGVQVNVLAAMCTVSDK